MDAKPTITIAIIDPSCCTMRGFKAEIEETGGYTVTLSALNGRDFITRHGAGMPVHLVLVEMHMPEMNGEETIRWLRANWPATRVLAMGSDRTPATLKQAHRAGAGGYLPKDVGVMELRDALRAMMERGRYLNEDLVQEHLAAGEPAPAEDPAAGLSVPEKRVLDHVCAADEPTWKVVAARMNKALSTIETHYRHMFKTLGVKSKPGLVSFGRLRGFGHGAYS